MKNTEAQPAPRLMTPREAASQLAVSEKTLANWRCEGGGPRFVKISRNRTGSNGPAGAIRYEVRELERWIAERTHTSTSSVATSSNRPAC